MALLLALGGWTSIMMQGVEPNEDGVYNDFDTGETSDYVHQGYSEALMQLYWPFGVKDYFSDIHSAAATHALRSFLTTGTADWSQA